MMTIKDAIDQLKDLKLDHGSRIEDGADDGVWEADVEALTMAIEWGELMTEPKPLTVEQLREMIGKPVWVKDLLIPACSEWHLVCRDGNEVWLFDCRNLIKGHVGYNASTGNGYSKTWLAYDREPERGEE